MVLRWNHRAKYFAAAVDSSGKDRLLPQLEIALQNPAELVTLRCWHQYAEQWNAIAISRVFARMFEFDPIRGDEAKFLLKSYIAGSRGTSRFRASIRASFSFQSDTRSI